MQDLLYPGCRHILGSRLNLFVLSPSNNKFLVCGLEKALPCSCCNTLISWLHYQCLVFTCRTAMLVPTKGLIELISSLQLIADAYGSSTESSQVWSELSLPLPIQVLAIVKDCWSWKSHLDHCVLWGYLVYTGDFCKPFSVSSTI